VVDRQTGAVHERWHRRARIEINAGSADAEDFLLAFFQSSYHLRDWLRNSGTATKEELDALISETPALRLCRDVANGSKHLTLKATERTERVGLLREYAPDSPTGWRWRLLAIKRRSDDAAELYEIDDLMDGCLEAWRSFCVGRAGSGLKPTTETR
jgi:hypothetical protein